MRKHSSWFAVCKTLLFLVICTCCLSVHSAYAQEENRASLYVLGIDTLEGYAENETVPVQALEQLIGRLTGTQTALADNRMEDVLKAFITALGYDYKLDGSPDAVIKTAAELRLIKDAYENTPVTRAQAETISGACLDVHPMIRKGSELDPKLVKGEETLALSRFGAAYEDGLVEASYRDGMKREQPLGKDEILVEGERYFCRNSEGMTGKKIEFAYLESEGKKHIILFRSQPDLVVSERTGHSGREFIRRGIPFEPGELQSEHGVYLKCTDGTVPPLQTEVMERHRDGSIKWLSASFMWDVEANREYSFYLVFETRGDTSSAVSASVSGSSAEMKNESLEAKIGKNGIRSLSMNGQPVTGGNGIRLSVNDGKATQYFTVNKISVVASGPVYAQLRLSGVFSGVNMSADWFITLYQGDSRLYHEVKYTSVGSNLLYAESIEVDFAQGYDQQRFDSNAQSENGIVFSTWYEVSRDSGGSVLLSSKDIERFEGAISNVGVHNGFTQSEDSRIVAFSPLQRDVPYTWPDGITRTVRMDMSFYDGRASEAEIAREKAWAFTPPAVTIASERFVHTGWIDDNSKSEAITRTEKLVTSLYGRLWKKFEAGKYPHRMEVDYANYYIIGGAYDRSGGEVEYNLWKSYMNTGNPVLFDMLSESAEFWVDFMIYRGQYETLLGTNRYQTSAYNSVSFMTSMPFYGDLSGIYMTWCITGDPYYKECFRLGIDHWEKSVSRGGGFPNVSYWYDTLGFNEQSTYIRGAQFRFCAQVRGLYIAYELFGEDRYYEAAKNIISFLAELQNDNGSFYEQYDYLSKQPRESETNDDGTKAVSDKIYIMEYGGRMLVDFYNASGYEPALEIVTRLGDYLLESMGKHGASWSPNVDDSIWVAASQRALASDPCAITFFTSLYEATGEDKYLEAAVKAFRCYIAAWNGGNMNADMETGYSTFLKSSQSVSRIFKAQAKKLAQMGYPDVAALVDSTTKERNDLYPQYREQVIKKRNKRHSLNVFDTKDGRIAYLYNCELKTWPNPDEAAFETEFKADSDTSLWYGHVQTVTNEGVFIRRTMEAFDNVALMKTDFKLLEFSGKVTAEIMGYTQDSIKIKLKGEGTVVFSLADGYFKVEDGSDYTETVGGAMRTLSAQNGVIADSISLNGSETVVEIARE